MGQVDLLKQITNRKQSILGLFIVAVTIFSTFYAAIASADVLESRSIVASTASIDAEAGSVQYQVNFTPEETAGALVIDFCSNSPVLGQACTPPTGMDLSGVTTATAGTTITGTQTANKIILTKTMTTAVAQSILLEDLTNPTSAGAVFVRMISYVDGTEAALYESDDPSNGDADPGGAITPIDTGSVTMYFNADVNVSGTVLETMTFCVSGTVINPNCAGATVPTITLGEGNPKALVAGTVSTGTLHTQMNTNADGGAVIRLKSSATCGGLMRLGTSECNIAAADGTGDVLSTGNTATFGVKTAAAATTAPGASNPIGTLQATGVYNNTNYRFNWEDDDSVGVTSVIGDPLLNTNGNPATNQNMELTFAATIATDTPAGTYSTDLSLIAVGTF